MHAGIFFIQVIEKKNDVNTYFVLETPSICYMHLFFVLVKLILRVRETTVLFSVGKKWTLKLCSTCFW